MKAARGLYIWGRFLGCVLFLLFALILVRDLFRIPVSINRSHEYAPEQKLWEKKDLSDPAVIEEQKRLEELQARCDHPTIDHRGHLVYYCPLCRKKILKGRPAISKL